MLFEYIWLDGSSPTPQLRSKTMVSGVADHYRGSVITSSAATRKTILNLLPRWKFDGSSTQQATGDQSDCCLIPVQVYNDPFRDGAFLVLCEVEDFKGDPLPSNTRAAAREIYVKCEDQDPRAAIEQEYFLIDPCTDLPLGLHWSAPKTEIRFVVGRPQGDYYCGVGSANAFGRMVAEDHLVKCIKAGVNVTGINAEVAPGQWEIQVGGPNVDALSTADDLWVARWILHRVSEDHGVIVSFDPKPLAGDWNGSGCHTNFSTVQTRSQNGIVDIIHMCQKLGQRVDHHLAAYGDGIERRLTGAHETCSYKEFKFGAGDRTASIRIPADVEKAGSGYFEDRRPNSNCDPYRVLGAIMDTCCVWEPPPSFRDTAEDSSDGEEDVA